MNKPMCVHAAKVKEKTITTILVSKWESTIVSSHPLTCLHK